MTSCVCRDMTRSMILSPSTGYIRMVLHEFTFMSLKTVDVRLYLHPAQTEIKSPSRLTLCFRMFWICCMFAVPVSLTDESLGDDGIYVKLMTYNFFNFQAGKQVNKQRWLFSYMNCNSYFISTNTTVQRFVYFTEAIHPQEMFASHWWLSIFACISFLPPFLTVWQQYRQQNNTNICVCSMCKQIYVKTVVKQSYSGACRFCLGLTAVNKITPTFVFVQCASKYM